MPYTGTGRVSAVLPYSEGGRLTMALRSPVASWTSSIQTSAGMHFTSGRRLKSRLQRTLEATRWRARQVLLSVATVDLQSALYPPSYACSQMFLRMSTQSRQRRMMENMKAVTKKEREEEGLDR